MLTWLRNKLGRREPAPSPPPAPSLPALRVVRPPAEPPKPVPPRATAPFCPPELVETAAEQVVAHFCDNHPGPGSFPGHAARIIDAIQQREPDFNKLVQIVGQDAAISARLLQIASSPRYGGGPKIHDVRAATLRIGLREVGEIALGIAGRSLFESDARAQHAMFRERWDGLFHDSMTAAFVAGTLSVSCRGGQPDRAFLAGMLHDVGRSIALRAVAALTLAGRMDETVLANGIDAVLDATHVEIGAAMATAWALPEYLQLAIAHHHDDIVPAAGERNELHLVRIVDGLAAAHGGMESEVSRARMAASATALGLSPPRLRVAVTEHDELVARVTAVFNVPAPRR